MNHRPNLLILVKCERAMDGREKSASAKVPDPQSRLSTQKLPLRAGGPTI